ncbi:MAG: phage scaffolding protein [Defluviitaleaceae bacterium]|nr:phage scaffolding protein [Defluviitaleaceae bacterium]
MKKAEFTALGISEELAAKAETASLEELKGFIPYARFKEVNDEKSKLAESLKERDGQLEALKNSSGNTEALKKEITKLQADNTKKDEKHAAEIKALKIETALDAALTAAKAKNVKAVKALLDLDDADLAKDGTIKGLDSQIKKLIEAEDTAFLFEPAETEPAKPNIKGAKPGESGTKAPDDKVDFAKMTYEELAAYMDANPGAEIPVTQTVAPVQTAAPPGANHN